MKYLITGGMGFIGLATGLELADKGHEVISLDLKTDKNQLGWAIGKDYGITPMLGNICDMNLHLIPELDGEYDGIIHCAAQTAVTHSLKDPRHDFITNARGTFEVCEFARRNDVPILYTSTNKVYGDNVNRVNKGETEKRYTWGKFAVDELFPIDLTGHTPYGTSKLAADLYVQDYHHTYGLQTLVFRQSCIYGSAQHGTEDQGWVSHMVRSWVNNRPIRIFGNGKQVRDMLHVDDLVDLIIRSIQTDKSGVFNIGGGHAHTISLLELFDMLNEWEPRDFDEMLSYHPWREQDQKIYISNLRKARKHLKFDPQITVEEGVKRMFNHEKSMRDSVRLR
jgi:CDP-paratose 2-epimerase